MARNFFKIDKGITFIPQASAPSDPQNGEIYYDSTLGGLRRYEAGAWVMFNAASAGAIYSYSYANASARTSATGFVSGDIGKVAQQTDNNSYWILTATTPTWSELTNTSVVSGLTWSTVSGTTQTMAANSGYVANNASQVVLTLPTTAAVGDLFAVVGKGAGGWKVAVSAGQTIYKDVNVSATGSGSISSDQANSCIELVCITANTDFEVRNSQGASTVVTYSFQGASKFYEAGGYNGSLLSSIQALTFSGESFATLSATLSVIHAFMSGGGVSSTAGYTMTGDTTGFVATNKIEKFLFSGETNSAISATVSTTSQNHGVTSKATKAYMAGGIDASGTTEYNRYEALTFSGDTIATLGTTLSTSRTVASNTAILKGYYEAGANHLSVNSSVIDGLTFSTEVSAVLVAVLVGTAKRDASGSPSTLKGYLASGTTDGTNGRTDIDALVFSGETNSTLGSVLSSSRFRPNGGPSTTKGYWVSGSFNGGTRSDAESIAFSGETVSTLASSVVITRAGSGAFQH